MLCLSIAPSRDNSLVLTTVPLRNWISINSLFVSYSYQTYFSILQMMIQRSESMNELTAIILRNRVKSQSMSNLFLEKHSHDTMF